MPVSSLCRDPVSRRALLRHSHLEVQKWCWVLHLKQSCDYRDVCKYKFSDSDHKRFYSPEQSAHGSYPTRPRSIRPKHRKWYNRYIINITELLTSFASQKYSVLDINQVSKWELQWSCWVLLFYCCTIFILHNKPIGNVSRTFCSKGVTHILNL